MGMRERERERDIGTNEDRTYFSITSYNVPGSDFLCSRMWGKVSSRKSWPTEIV